MHKKSVIIIVVVTLLLISSVFTIILFTNSKKNEETDDTTLSPEVELPVVSKTWNDPAGFTLEIPEDITIDTHEKDDTVNYAHLELTHPEHPGFIIVWVKDTTASDVTAWVRTEAAFEGANIIDTVLGGKAGKKVIVSEPRKVVYTGIISDGLLFLVEGNFGDDPYWSGLYNSLTGSFVLLPTPTQPGSAASSNSAPAASYDEEEVLE